MCARTAAAGERGRPGDGIPLSRLWPKTWRVLEQGISLLREGGSQHRICLDTGFRRRPAKRKSRAEARCCLGRQVVVIEDLKETAKQLRAIGGSLNRLTVLANMGRVEIANLDGLARELAMVSTALREIQERGRWNR